MDENVSWKSTYMSSVGAPVVVQLSESAHLFPRTRQSIYKELIEPHFECCSVAWDGLSQQLREKLQKLQSETTRSNC